MNVDTKNHRVLAAHTEAGYLTVYSYKTGKVTEVKTGAINGVQVNDKLGKIFVAGQDQMLTVVDQKTLKVGKSVKFNGPCDDIVLDTKRMNVYVCNDDGTLDWVVNARTMKKLGQVKVDEAPEFVLYEPSTDLIYQNIKSTDKLQVINPKTMKVVKEWGSGAMKKPHGLAINEKTGHVISVGSNGKMIIYNLHSGKILQTLSVSSGVDQIAMDPTNGKVYCAAKGFISVVQDRAGKAKFLGNVPSPAGAHTITVDPATHDVWVCYSGDDGAHLARFKAH